jgi:hypothetical protein
MSNGQIGMMSGAACDWAANFGAVLSRPGYLSSGRIAPIV